jgi:pyruvate dehydrogenase E1 component alpha subunit
MPRERIEVPSTIEYLSILDKNGDVDAELEPDLSEEFLLELHYSMLLSRRFDERLLRLQRQGRIGTFAPVNGQEAAQTGAVSALEEDDWVVPAFRETAAAVWRELPLSGILVYNAGFNEGGHIPEGYHDLPITIPVASQLPHAVGIAYGIKYWEEEQVVMTFCGDGATSEGDFHEALNFAAVFNTPVIFVIQNNGWAISLPRERQTRSKTLAQKAIAYGLPGIQVDGNDLLAVHVAATEAVERARAGDGPTVIECVTYRMSVHTTADDPGKYRDEQEVEEWAKRDPITRFQNYLISEGTLSEEAIENLEQEIKEQVDEAWEEAQQQIEALGDPLDMFDHQYAELPPYLKEQREKFRDFLATRSDIENSPGADSEPEGEEDEDG